MKVSEDYFDNDEFKEILAQYEDAEQAGAFFLDAEELADIADYYNCKGEKAKAREAAILAHERFPGAPAPIIFLAREALDNEDIERASCLLEQIDDKDGPDYAYLKGEILVAQDKTDEADAILRTFLDTLSEEKELYDCFILDIMELYTDYAVFDKLWEWGNLTDRLNDDEDFCLMKVKALVGTMRNEEAVEMAEKQLDKDPYSEPFWVALALAQYGLGKFDDALKSCEYAIAIKPEEHFALVTKANILFQLNNYEEAIKYYEKYFEKGPDNESVELNAGMCLVNLKRYDEAVRHLEHGALLAQPETELMQKILQELVWTYGALKKMDKAMEAADRLTENGENKYVVDALRVHVLLQNDKLNEAVRQGWLTAFESKFDPDIMTRVAIAFLDNHKPGYAYQLFKIVYKTHPDYHECYTYMALACYDLRRDKDFLKYLRLAETMEPYEAGMLLGRLFPPELKPGEYYNFLFNRLKTKKGK